MKQSDQVGAVCKSCATWAFARWRGWCSVGTETWHEKPDLPEVPELVSGTCPRCGGADTIPIDDIYYCNFHSASNTGLPNYFYLEIRSSDPHDMRRWGRPFRDPWITERIPLDSLEAHVARGRWR